MANIGRNDPCPCGSGRKYKKCCLQSGASGAPAPSGDDREAALAALDRFVAGPGWRDVGARALAEFWDDLDPSTTAIETSPTIEAMSVQIFEWWFFFDYEYEYDSESGSGRRVVDAFVEATPSLPAGVREFLSRARASLLRVYEVTEVRPGAGMTLRDVLSGRETRVGERLGSQSLHRWDTIATRIFPISGASEPVLDGGVLPLSPARAKSLTEWLRTERASGDYESDEDFFSTVVPDIHRAWIAPVQMPSLVNYDGDPLVFTTVHFDVNDPATVSAALDAGKGLERDSDVGDTPKWAWTGKGKSRKDPVVFGWITLKEAHLEFLTNSTKRAERGRSLIERLAGAAVTYRLTVTEDPEQAMKAFKASGAPFAESTDAMAIPATSGLPPELQDPAQNAVEQYLTQHYERWLDEPVPRLGDTTPRDAARTAGERAELVVMLKELERMYEGALSRGEPGFDPSWMWEELGLDAERDSPASRKQAPILGHESLAEHYPELLDIGRDVATRLRAATGQGQVPRLVSPEDLEHDLAYQRFVRQGPNPDFALHAATVASNFELLLRKVFWVGDSLSWMLGATRLDVTGDAVRLPFASTAFVFTDRYALGLAERMASRLPADLRVGRTLQVLTVYASENTSPEGAREEHERRTIDLTFVGDVLDGTPPSVIPCRLELSRDERLHEALRRLVPGVAELDEDDVVRPLYESTPLRDLVSLVVNAVLYATSPDAERQPIEPATNRADRERERDRGQPKNVPVFTSETVFYLPGTIDIKTLTHVKKARRGGRDREQLHRCMVRGHWRRAHENWDDQRPRWIRPHWRGPSAAAIVERPYRMDV